VAAGWLLLYGINAYWLTAVHNAKFGQRERPRGRMVGKKQRALAMSARGSVKKSRNGFGSSVATALPTDATEGGGLPTVTVQLPIFNERYVAQRLLDAVCQLDYPRDRMYIQVLDDSTDDTQEILQAAVTAQQRQGYWVDYIHREDRTGFKAGALQAAMPEVQGEYIAIFDADFVPRPDWLKRTIAHYCQDPDSRIAVVQTRWGHMNSEYSLLTRLQSAGIDGHFAIEQKARCQQGYFLNFNGTAGIWSKQAIIDSGGWHADTLAEDMDLSYRAQLKGWRVVYDNDIVAPAELPVAMAAFKLQQFRWAKGSIQCAKKLIPTIAKSRLNLATKCQAILHLTGYSVHPLMLLIILLAVPLMLMIPPELTTIRNAFSGFWAICMMPATFGPPFLYLTAQRELYPRTWTRRMGRITLLALLGTGISFSNSRAVIAGLFNTGANFRRTPKYNIKQKGDRWDNKAYKIPFDTTALIEISLCLYSCIAAIISLNEGLYLTLPFMVLYALGYGYVGGLTLWQTWQMCR
jgi:cellulose synthase/poly-beta-1,6-N-acetylglucosamine synthase-like glycosyltransferase